MLIIQRVLSRLLSKGLYCRNDLVSKMPSVQSVNVGAIEVEAIKAEIT